jgi:hypothetical protein
MGTVAWLLTIGQVIAGAVSDGGPYDAALLAIAVLGLAACVAWLRSWRHWRPAVIVTAAMYLGFHVTRTYAFQVEPLLVIIPLSQAWADAFYVVWSSTAHELSHGAVITGLSDLFREWLMPLIQIAVIAGAIAA